MACIKQKDDSTQQSFNEHTHTINTSVQEASEIAVNAEFGKPLSRKKEYTDALKNLANITEDIKARIDYNKALIKDKSLLKSQNKTITQIRKNTKKLEKELSTSSKTIQKYS